MSDGTNLGLGLGLGLSRRQAARLLLILVLGLVCGGAGLALWASPIDPVAWEAPASPGLVGPYAVNDRLRAAQVLPLPAPHAGPEAVAADAEGRLYTGVVGGEILRLLQDGGGVEVVARTGGRPLGLRFAPPSVGPLAGQLIVADADRGLLAVDLVAGGVRVLAAEHGGVPFRLTDDLAITRSGVVYFTDASSRFPLSRYVMDLLEHRGSGRLLSYDLRSGETRQVLGDLRFPNGVALSLDETFLLVCETGRYRVLRHALRGADAGSTVPFIEGLPGFPDNITTSPRGIFWLALAAPRSRIVDVLAPWPLLRRVVGGLPPALRPKPRRHAIVLGLDAGGSVVHNLQDSGPDAYAPLTSATEVGGWLYLGSFARPALARVPIPAT